MSDMIAIGYPDETTAELAAEEARRLAKDLIIEPDAIAFIVRDTEGKYHVTTNHHSVAGGATWGMFWGILFGLLLPLGASRCLERGRSRTFLAVFLAVSAINAVRSSTPILGSASSGQSREIVTSPKRSAVAKAERGSTTITS